MYIIFIISILQPPQNTPWTKLACEKQCFGWSSNLVTFTLNETRFTRKPRQYFFEPNLVQGGCPPRKCICMYFFSIIYKSSFLVVKMLRKSWWVDKLISWWVYVGVVSSSLFSVVSFSGFFTLFTFNFSLFFRHSELGTILNFNLSEIENSLSVLFQAAFPLPFYA